MGAWLALRCALNPGAATGMVLATALFGIAPHAWGSEPPGDQLAAENFAANELFQSDLPQDDGAAGDLARSSLSAEDWSIEDQVVSPKTQLKTQPGYPQLPPPGAAPIGLAPVLAQSIPVAPAEENVPGETEAAEPETISPDSLPATDTAEPTLPAQDVAQTSTSEPETAAPETTLAPAERSEVFVQAAYLQEGSEGSARLRAGGIYVLSPSVFAGATVDLSTGQAFSDTDQTGLSLSELYLTASPANLSELRFTVGLMDLTSYLDRNSFAKDSLTHFFNPVFQTNPALSTVNVASRPGALVNWTPVDALSLTATAFSSSRSLSDFAIDSFAGEVGVRFGNAIVRGTYVTSVDAGRRDGFSEIFAIDRGNGQFGPLPGDRETGFGLNAEAFIPNLKLGFFGRYGWYTNQTLGVSGQTYSLGLNGLDVFMPGDRLGLGYGRQLSNSELRQASGGPVPDVWELFYDAQIIDNLRAGVSVQQRNAFSETYLGFRVRYDLIWNPLRRAAE
ncbi:carbohydrate porin [Nodosilinea sp. AN01ver1]|uniref:carbohydrate porin n=1 Tax=Nodosilinea sp. AN01ver1 TaxID=3423362 RepID=UPI003D320E67